MVGVASVGDNPPPQITLSRGVVHSQSTFHLTREDLLLDSLNAECRRFSVELTSTVLSINQSKRIYIAPYVAGESEARGFSLTV